MDRKELEGRSAAFADHVFALCQVIREKPGGEDPADQLQGAASSAAANYRASARARTPKEFVAKLGVVNEESDEAVYWLEFVGNAALTSGPELQRLLQESRELRAIFAASYGTARRREAEREEQRRRSKIKRSRDRSITRSSGR
jgi:four helix bundle protein